MYQIECTDTHTNAAFEMHFVNIVSPFAVVQDRHTFPAHKGIRIIMKNVKEIEVRLRINAMLFTYMIENRYEFSIPP